MSSMLEQAIVDANALKEVAVKNAEQVIIEKYSADIKEAVSALLEQEEELALGPPVEAGGEETFDDVEAPSAATPGEDTCPCPGEEETVTLDLAGLEAALQAMPEEPVESEEELGLELAPELPEEEALPALEESIEIDDVRTHCPRLLIIYVYRAIWLRQRYTPT